MAPMQILSLQMVFDGLEETVVHRAVPCRCPINFVRCGDNSSLQENQEKFWKRVRLKLIKEAV